MKHKSYISSPGGTKIIGFAEYLTVFVIMGSLEIYSQEWAPTPKLPDSVMEMFDMTGKVAIITGGSGGIGYEAARALAEAGANVGCPSRFQRFPISTLPN